MQIESQRAGTCSLAVPSLSPLVIAALCSVPSVQRVAPRAEEHPPLLPVITLAAGDSTYSIGVSKVGWVRSTESVLHVRRGLASAGDPWLRLSMGAKVLLGPQEIDRLRSFLSIEAGWDGPGSMPLNLESMQRFSDFFGSYPPRIQGAGVFMSRLGNVVVNWMEKGLVELEFGPDGIGYFVEASGMEGVIPYGEQSAQALAGALGHFSLVD